jgi:hypothetical protein
MTLPPPGQSDPDPNDLIEGRAIPESQNLPTLPPGDHECDICGGTGRVSDPVPFEGRHRMHLERGWRKRYLIMELAKGELSQRELARIMHCHSSSVTDFRRRHQPEIEEAVQKIEDEFVGLWVASKAARLAEYQQDVEDANEIISEEMGSRSTPREQNPLDPGANDEDDPPLSSAPIWVRLKGAALRAVAEELGQIPNRVRMDLGGTVVTYRIEGEPGQAEVDLDQL